MVIIILNSIASTKIIWPLLFKVQQNHDPHCTQQSLNLCIGETEFLDSAHHIHVQQRPDWALQLQYWKRHKHNCVEVIFSSFSYCETQFVVPVSHHNHVQQKPDWVLQLQWQNVKTHKHNHSHVERPDKLCKEVFIWARHSSWSQPISTTCLWKIHKYTNTKTQKHIYTLQLLYWRDTVPEPCI